MYFIGCTSIYLMAAISFERFYIIYKPLSIRNVNLKTNFLIIVLCAMNGLMWASFPLMGWSHYSLEGAMTSCAVEWKERSFNVTSYNVTIFSVVYLMPFICIVTTNIKLILIVCKIIFRNFIMSSFLKTKKESLTTSIVQIYLS